MKTLARLRDWWRAREARERYLLMTMMAMLVAFVYWYALLAPLHTLRAAAQAHYDRAAGELVAVQSEVAAIRLLRGGRSPPTDGTVAEYVLDAAAAAGLEPRPVQQDVQGKLVIAIDAADAASLFGWLDGLKNDHGIAPVSLRVSRDANLLRAEAVFDEATP